MVCMYIYMRGPNMGPEPCLDLPPKRYPKFSVECQEQAHDGMASANPK